MKKFFVVLLILTLVQTACGLPRVIDVQPTPSQPVVTTDAIPVQASATEPETVEIPLTGASATDESQTPTVSSTEMPTPTTTLTETSTPVKLFSDVVLSAQVISPNCGPQSVHIEVSSTDPRVYSIALFIRLHYKNVGDKTSWNEGSAMKPVGGKFAYELKAASIADFNKFRDPVAWVQFQLVAISNDGTVIGRSEVFTDKLTITSICP